MGRIEKPFDRGAAGPFGTWVWDTLQSHERRTGRRISIDILADEGGFDYSHLHGVIKGRRGQPVNPRSETVKKLIETLESLGVEIDAQAGMRLADIVPEGYRLIKETASAPPENFADWPQELQEALAFSRTLTPEAQGYVYQLWREQARAHADIELRRQEAERQLEERQRQLDRLPAAAGA